MNLLELRLKEKFPNEKLLVLKYSSAREPAKIKCLTCGTVYELASAYNFYNKNKKCICPKCNDNKIGGHLNLEEIQNRINNYFPKENLTVLSYTIMKSPILV